MNDCPFGPEDNKLWVNNNNGEFFSEESSAIRQGEEHRKNIGTSAHKFAIKHNVGIGSIPDHSKEQVKKIISEMARKNETV